MQRLREQAFSTRSSSVTSPQSSVTTLSAHQVSPQSTESRNGILLPPPPGIPVRASLDDTHSLNFGSFNLNEIVPEPVSLGSGFNLFDGSLFNLREAIAPPVSKPVEPLILPGLSSLSNEGKDYSLFGSLNEDKKPSSVDSERWESIFSFLDESPDEQQSKASEESFTFPPGFFGASLSSGLGSLGRLSHDLQFSLQSPNEILETFTLSPTAPLLNPNVPAFAPQSRVVSGASTFSSSGPSAYSPVTSVQPNDRQSFAPRYSQPIVPGYSQPINQGYAQPADQTRYYQSYSQQPTVQVGNYGFPQPLQHRPMHQSPYSNMNQQQPQLSMQTRKTGGRQLQTNAHLQHPYERLGNGPNRY